MSPLAKLAPTLAAYKELDAGLIRIGSSWMVFLGDHIHDEQTYPSRLLAVHALYNLALDQQPTKRQVEARQSALRG